MQWTVGVELEWLAPQGSDRRAIAQRLADAHGGTVVPVFHRDSEPSLVPGTPVFDNLSVGFEVHGPRGWLARCVDDLTLQADLDRVCAPKPGWWRVVSDDRRLLHLVARHGRADGTIEEALAPLAALFGTSLEMGTNGIVRVSDPDGASVALGAPLPGERERGCELVTAPMHDWSELHELLEPLEDCGLVVAKESATHLHVDGRAFEDARVFADLVELWTEHGEALKDAVGTNPRCRRLGAWPPHLLVAVRQPDFRGLPWCDARARLQTLGLSKFVDLNLKNIVHPRPDKRTVEVRVLPGLRRGAEVVEAAAPFLALLSRACRG